MRLISKCKFTILYTLLIFALAGVRLVWDSYTWNDFGRGASHVLPQMSNDSLFTWLIGLVFALFIVPLTMLAYWALLAMLLVSPFLLPMAIAGDILANRASKLWLLLPVLFFAMILAVSKIYGLFWLSLASAHT